MSNLEVINAIHEHITLEYGLYGQRHLNSINYVDDQGYKYQVLASTDRNDNVYITIEEKPSYKKMGPCHYVRIEANDPDMVPKILCALKQVGLFVFAKREIWYSIPDFALDWV
jgi:hypothetical protein